MANYLDLPAEIRQQIVSYALCLARDAPIPGEAIRGSTVLSCLPPQGLRDVLARDYGPLNVIFADDGYVSNAQSMCLVCHTFDADVSEVTRLSRCQREPVVYELDLLIVNNNQVLSTWIYIPCIVRQPDVVYVNIRGIQDVELDMWWQGNIVRAHGTSTGHSGEPCPFWCFYFLLEDYLFNGVWNSQTQRLLRSPNPRHGFSIRELVINMDYELPRDLPGNLYNPQSLVARLTRELAAAWKQPRWTEILLERVGDLQLLFPGWQPRFPIAQSLILIVYNRVWSTPFVDYYDWHRSLPSACQYSTFWNWKLQTYRNRRALGLPVYAEDAHLWPTLAALRYRMREARFYHHVTLYSRRHAGTLTQAQLKAIELETFRESWLSRHCLCHRRDLERKLELDEFRLLSPREQLRKVVGRVLWQIRLRRMKEQLATWGFELDI